MSVEPPVPVIRQGDESDAERLSELAARLFRQAYEGQMPAHGLEFYLAEDFGPAQQLGELRDPGITSLLLETDGELVGYARLRRKPIPIADDLDIGLELWRIYFDRNGFEAVGSQMFEIGRELHTDIVMTARTDAL